MPLSELSPNVQEMDSRERKRSHEQFSADLGQGKDNPRNGMATMTPVLPDDILSPHLQAKLQSSPRHFKSPEIAHTRSSSNSPPGSLSSLTPTKVYRNGRTESTTDAGTGSSQGGASVKAPTSKRKRLTAEEKEIKEKDLEEKKRERSEQAARKAAEKARLEEDKALRVKEREEKRKKKEEEDHVKAEQRQEKRRKKEDEQRRAREEEAKKTRSQPTLNAFFKSPTTSKRADCGKSSLNDSPLKANAVRPGSQETEYDKVFKPFFLRENTKLAPTATQLDEELRREKIRHLDHILSKPQKSPERECRAFDATTLLIINPSRRGRIHQPVKHIMETAYRKAENTNSRIAADVAGHVLEQARRELADIPQKVIAFSQDVRPPYCGTMTHLPFVLGRTKMKRLARQPTRRQLPLEYDYDSEAEWQDDEGEDIDVDNDEEEVDDEDDMDGFLDDAEDAGLSRRIFGNMDPQSTGICFENHDCHNPIRLVYEHKMEFLHGLEHDSGVDPFSTTYWQTSIKGRLGPTQLGGNGIASMPPPPSAPVNAFAALKGDAVSAAPPANLVQAGLMNDVKQAILNNRALSKVGIIDFIFHQFQSHVSRAQVKNTIEHVAEKRGSGRSKEWVLKPGHEIAS